MGANPKSRGLLFYWNPGPGRNSDEILESGYRRGSIVLFEFSGDIPIFNLVSKFLMVFDKIKVSILKLFQHSIAYRKQDTRTKQKVTITLDKFEFIKRLLSHIPEKNFKIIRCYGVYSRRGHKNVQTEFTEGEEIIIKKKWREEILRTFRYDPLICPKCKIEMELIEICYEGSESYPTEEPPPGKPPPAYSQQERMQILAAIIVENKNGRGASLEKVVSIAVSKGIEREQVLKDIQHMKFHGYVYEPRKGEIAYVY